MSTTKLALCSQHVLPIWAGLTEKYSEIDLIVRSSGGDPHTAYQMGEIIRGHMSNPRKGLTAVVPMLAASAATLLCLACDQIILDDLARLGPLDMQVYEDLKGGMYRFSSALHPQSALKQLNEISLASLLSTKNALLSDGVLGDEAYAIATNFVTGLYKGLYDQISPERLAEYSRALDVNLKYAQCLLERHSNLPEADRETLAKKLVRDYPSHAYYIDFMEATTLKLPVVPFAQNVLAMRLPLLLQLVSAPSGTKIYFPKPIPSQAKSPKMSQKRPSNLRKKPAATKVAAVRSNGRALAVASSTNGKR